MLAVTWLTEGIIYPGTKLDKLPNAGSHLNPIQLLPESLTLNCWFKFEPATGCSATYLKFIKFGPIMVFPTVNFLSLTMKNINLKFPLNISMFSLVYTNYDSLYLPGGMIVLYLCAQLAVLYTYNCLLILIYYRLGQGELNTRRGQ